MTIHFWTARFRDATTEAEFTPTQFDERRRRLGFLTWGLLALVGSHLISESWAGNSPAGRDSALGLQLQLLVLILSGGFLLYLRVWATQTQLPGLAIFLVGMVILALAPPIATDPHYEFSAPLVFICGTLFFYVYLPVDLAPRTLLCLLGSLTLWVSWVFLRHPPPPESDLIYASAWLALTNLVGFNTARIQQIKNRRLFSQVRELEEALHREQEARNQQMRFTELIAHEFRNPLAIIKSQAQVAQREASSHPTAAGRDKASQRQATIERAVDRLDMLFEQWLAADRLTSGKLDPQLDTLPLGPWLAHLTQSFGDQAGRPLTLDLPESVAAAVVRGDERLLGSALLNLLDNATKYSPTQSAIQVRALLAGQEAGIQVSDAGIGIAENDQQRIFDKSVRLHPEAGISGMGLGLPLARRIASLHGGRIDVASRLGQGSTFTLWLPLSA